MKTTVVTYIQFLGAEQGKVVGAFKSQAVTSREKPTEFPPGAKAYYFYDDVTVEVDHKSKTLTHTWKGVEKSDYFLEDGMIIKIEDAIARGIDTIDM